MPPAARRSPVVGSPVAGDLHRPRCGAGRRVADDPSVGCARHHAVGGGAALLDLEQVREVGGDGQHQRVLLRLPAEVLEGDVLDEPVADVALPHHEQGAVGEAVAGLAPGDEGGGVRTDRLDAEWLEPVTVHGQHEVLHEPGVLHDQPVGRRAAEVPDPVGHAERAALHERDIGTRARVRRTARERPSLAHASTPTPHRGGCQTERPDPAALRRPEGRAGAAAAAEVMMGHGRGVPAPDPW